MLDNKNLSKYKNIHRLYCAKDGTFHIEKYPIIYMNKEVVYYKTGRDNEHINHLCLKDIDKRAIYSSINLLLESIERNNTYNYKYLDLFFFNISNDKIDQLKLESILKKIKESKEINDLKNDVDTVRMNAERTKKQYELSLVRLEQLEKKLKEKESQGENN